METKKRTGLQLLSILLCMVMLLGILPMQSFAKELKETKWYQSRQLEASMPEKEEEPAALVVGEITEKREENEKHFRLEDGTAAVALYDYPVHYEDENGNWQDINNTLSLDKNENDEAVYSNQDAPVSIKFAKKSNGSKLVSIKSDKGDISWNLLGKKGRSNSDSEFKVATPVKKRSAEDLGQIGGMGVKNVVSEGVYEDILPDVDLQYIVRANGSKENIILKSKNTANSYSFEIKHNGLAVRTEADGSVTFYDPTVPEEAVFTFATPFATDAKGALCQDVHFSVEQGSNKSVLTVTVDENWLKESGRAYPVVIDPYTKPDAKSDKIMDTFVRANNPNSGIVGTYGSFLVGKNYDYGICRSLVKFNELPQLNNGDIIYDAYLDMVQYEFSANDNAAFNVGAYEPLSGWNEGSTTWNNQPAADGNALDYVAVDNAVAYRRLNITKLVRKWYNTGVNNGVMLKSMAENKYAISRYFTSDYPFNQPGNYTGGSEYYPTGVFCYKNATGVEDYWNYHQQSAGTAGTGQTNDFNGNLTFLHEDASTSDPLMAAGATHVYNLSESEQSSRFGNGWNLNVLQRFEPTSGILVADFPYVYTDADGTRHYFYNDNGTYKDEDGLGMVYNAIDEGELKHKLTLKDKTVLKFDVWSNIRRVIDPNGNTIAYNHGPNAWGNYIGNMTDASGNIIRFEYTGDAQMSKLTAIRDEAGRAIQYAYDGIGNLTQITYPDGTCSKYSYDGKKLTAAESSDGYRIEYQYSSDQRVPRVSRIVEKDGSGAVGQELAIRYENGCTTVFEDGGQDGLLATPGDNDATTYNFDRFGRMNDIYDKESNAVSAEYYGDTSGDKKNKLQSESNLNKTAENYLTNGRVQNHRNDSWYAKEQDNGLPFGVSGFADGYDDNSCFKVQKATNFSTAGVAQDIINLPVGTYTFSAYVKPESQLPYANHEGYGAGIMLDVYNTAGQLVTRKFAEYVRTTDKTNLERGWQRVSVTIDITDGNNRVQAFGGIFNSSGTVYFDNFQLERGNAPSAPNLINNGGFEITYGGNQPYAWGGSKEAGIMEVRGDNAKFGQKRLLMSSEPGKQNRISQAINLKPGPEGDVFTLSGWANGVPSGKGRFQLAAAVLYQNHDPIWHVIDFDSNITNWQYGNITFSTDDNNSSTNLIYDAIHIYLFYEDNVNEMSFDGLQLLKDSGQSYVYNDKGDLVSAKNAADSSQFSYDGNANLTSMTDVTGTSFDYNYDNKNNLTKAVNSDGLKYNFTYDSKGNALTSQIGGSSEQNKVVAGKTYYVRLKSTGKYLTNLGHSDANGAAIGQYEKDYFSDEQWRLESVGGGYYKFVNVYSSVGRALDVAYGNTAEGANVQLHDSNNSDAQKFKLKRLEDGGYQILSKCSGDRQAITNETNSLDNAAILDMRTARDGYYNQVWYFEEVGHSTAAPRDGGTYKFRSYYTSQYMNVYAGLTEAGTPIIQYWYLDYPIQQFRLADAGDGCYFIEPLQAPGMALGESNQTRDGYPLLETQLKNADNDKQKFRFTLSAGKDEYAVQCKGSGRFVELFGNINQLAMNIVTSGGGTAAQRKDWSLEEIEPNTITASSTYAPGTNKVSTQTDARGNSTSYNYTSGNRLLSDVTANGSATNYTYDPNNDLLTSVSGGSQNQKVANTYGYDKGKLKTIGHNGFNYNFNYDGFGNVTSTGVGTQNLITNTYNNQRALLTRSAYGNGDFVDYTYDRYGNLIRQSTNTGPNYTYTYDTKHNPLTVTNDDSGDSTYFSYDFIGRPLRVTAGNHDMGIVYDDKNRVSVFNNQVDSLKVKTQYLYGDPKAGQAPSVVYGLKVNDKQVLDYTYDRLIRLSKRTLQTTSPFVTEYTYAPGNAANKTTTLLESIKNKDNLLSYTYDPAGNILTISENGTLKNTYTYDALNQLTEEVDSITGVHKTFTYDAGGNITANNTFTLTPEGVRTGETAVQYGYEDANWKDKMTAYDGQTITYDPIGNPLSYRDGMSFQWKTGRQLTNAQSGANNMIFAYNDQGIRTLKAVNGQSTHYYLNGSSIVTQVQGSTRLDFLYDDAGDLLGFLYNGNSYYYVRNGQNDIIGILDKDGNQVVSYTYDAWGVPTDISGTGAETLGNLNPFRYRGYYYDSESGLYYLNSRYYDPVVGRFLNADIVDVAAVDQKDTTNKNLFAYCDNNPINRNDDSGHFWHIVIGATAGLVIETTAYVISQKMDGKEMTLGGIAASIVSGAISGGLAASGVGLIGQVAVNTSLAIATELINQKSNGEKLNLKRVAIVAAVAAGTSAIGGPGVGKTLSKLSKQPFKKAASVATRKGVTAGAKQFTKSVKYMSKQVPFRGFINVGLKPARGTIAEHAFSFGAQYQLFNKK